MACVNWLREGESRAARYCTGWMIYMSEATQREKALEGLIFPSTADGRTARKSAVNLQCL